MPTETTAWEGDAAAGRAPSSLAVSRLVSHCISARDMPVDCVRVYARDVVVSKTLPAGVVVGKFGTGGRRGVVREWTRQALYRLRHVVANCQVQFACMVTLTYPAEWTRDGKAVKAHFRAFSKRLKRKFPEVAGVWFMEFQLRGAPHYHILLNLKIWEMGKLVERTRRHNKLGKRKYRTVVWVQEMLSSWWYDIVESGDEKHLRAGCAVEVIEEENGAIRYTASHASKPHQKRIPIDYQDCGKLWGVIGGVRAVPLEIIPCDSSEIFAVLGVEAMSSQGRVKKYLWDSSERFS